MTATATRVGGRHGLVLRIVIVSVVAFTLTTLLTAAPAVAAPAPLPLSSAHCPFHVARGQYSGCVTQLQILLNANGASLDVDGDFGRLTYRAVRRYQADHGLGVDGIVGPITKASLEGSPPPGPGPTPAPAPIPLSSPGCPALIRQGQFSGCVTQLQTLLNNNGASLDVDGDFGPLTRNAVESYQATRGLEVDGIVGPYTKAALESAAPPTAPRPPPAGSPQERAVSFARSIANGNAEPGWGGGRVPYSWGGGHPNRTPGPSLGTCQGYTGSIRPCPADRTRGVDCSGFTRWVYYLAFGHDILGGGNTNHHVARGRRVSAADAVPGDLVFYGSSPSNTHHVGVYIGNGRMINAPFTGAYVRSDPLHSRIVGFYRYG